MKVIIETLPRSQMRYNIVGDWWWDPDGTLQIRICDLGNEIWNFVLGLHEHFEAVACKKNGVPEPEVMKFDLWFDEAKEKGLIPEHISEPGFHPGNPYQREHLGATAVEMMALCLLDGVWADYDKAIIEAS